MISQHYSPQCDWKHPWTLSKTSYIRTTLFTKNKTNHTEHHRTPGVLPPQHLLPVQRYVLWTGWGCSQGFPVSPVVANLYMEFFKEKTLRTSQNPPWLWKRFVDNTFVKKCTEHKKNFLQYINSINRAIKFTVEDTRPDGLMPFFDTLVILENKGTFNTRLYRKPTHTDQYLQGTNNHPIWAKYYVINTINHRTKTTSSTTEHLEMEVGHIKEVVTKWKYPAWIIEQMGCKIFHQGRPNKDSNNNQNNNKTKGYMFIPYV